MKYQDAWRFSAQFLFSFIVLVFCLCKLSGTADDRDNALYWGGITGILAWWMPSPGNGQRTMQEERENSISLSNATIEKTQIQATQTTNDRAIRTNTN